MLGIGSLQTCQISSEIMYPVTRMRRQELSVVARKYSCLSGLLDERMRRLWAATEASSLPYGGVSLVARATGLSRSTIHAGMRELQNGPHEDTATGRNRRVGGGRKPLTYHSPGLCEALARIIAPSSGNAESPLVWTCKSTRYLAGELRQLGYQIGDRKVADLLHEMQYRLHAKGQAGGKDELQRNSQFEYINTLTRSFLARGLPVISVETRKKQLAPLSENVQNRQPRTAGEGRVGGCGETKHGGATANGAGFQSRDAGWSIAGVDSDTAEFALDSILSWWKHMGRWRFPKATELFIVVDTVDKPDRSHLWKMLGQHVADLTLLQTHVSHFPPGTSKWNEVEGQMSWFTLQTWRESSMVACQVVVNLIGSMKTNASPKGTTEMVDSPSAEGFAFRTSSTTQFILQPASFRGEWNYTLLPHGMQCQAIEFNPR
jgi:hypothetical protein